MLDGKVAVVTGGTRGIGFATVKKFLENEAKVILLGSRKESVDKAISELKSINENYNKDVLILGVGNTNKIISLLEEQVVNATAVQNEFNIGYIAVKNAIELKNGKKVEESKVIKSTVIASEDMYSPKNERILFQFVR